MALYSWAEVWRPADHRSASAAYSDAPGVRSVGMGDLLASAFAFFPWS